MQGCWAGHTLQTDTIHGQFFGHLFIFKDVRQPKLKYDPCQHKKIRRTPRAVAIGTARSSDQRLRSSTSLPFVKNRENPDYLTAC